MAPAKFLQAHDVKSLGDYFQKKKERRMQRDLGRQNGEKGQEKPSQHLMVNPGPQAILKTETTVPTEPQTVDLFYMSSYSSPDFDSQGTGNLTHPLSATDKGVGNAARKDLQLPRPEACKGSEPALCSFTMENLAANTGDSLTSTLTSPPIPDEALVNPVPGPLLPNRQNSQFSSKQTNLKGAGGHEICSPVFDSESRSIGGLNLEIAVKSLGSTATPGSDQCIRDCTDHPAVSAGSAAQKPDGEERVIGALDFEIDKTCSSSLDATPKPLLPPLNSVADNAIGGQNHLHKSVEKEVGSLNLHFFGEHQPDILFTKGLRSLPPRRPVSRGYKTPRISSPTQPMCVPGITTYSMGRRNSPSHAVNTTGNYKSHQDHTDIQLSIATPSSSCSSPRTSISVDRTPTPRLRRSRQHFGRHNNPSTRRPSYSRTPYRVSKNTRTTPRIPIKTPSSHPVLRAIQPYKTCHACGFSPDHLIQLSDAVDTFIKSTAMLPDGVKGMLMFKVVLSTLRDYAMNLSSLGTRHGNLDATGIVAVQTSAGTDAPSEDESMDDTDGDMDSQSDSTSSESTSLHTVDKGQGGKRRRWSKLDERRLRAWMQEGKDWVWISKRLDRSEAAVSQHWKIMKRKIR